MLRKTVEKVIKAFLKTYNYYNQFMTFKGAMSAMKHLVKK